MKSCFKKLCSTAKMAKEFENLTGNLMFFVSVVDHFCISLSNKNVNAVVN